MSRHGYSDAPEGLAMWRGVIASATRGKRGQAFFRALVTALDAMPEKRLVSGELQDAEGSVCALGCLARARGRDLSTLDTYDWDSLGEMFDIAPQLSQEVMFMNDDGISHRNWTPENRWQFVRDWAAKQIVPMPDELVKEEA